MDDGGDDSEDGEEEKNDISGSEELPRHPAHLPGLLLARHGQLGHKPLHLLPDERHVWRTASSSELWQERRWECYCKYTEQNCFRYFVSKK